MNARADAGIRLRPMGTADLAAVMAVELRAYSFPWTHGNFVDSLAAGYLALLRLDAAGGLLGYLVAMAGVDELHLLNLTVAPEHQGHGHAGALLDALHRHGCERGLASLWLEVRAGNTHARQVYRHRGFAEVGLRRGYYPAPMGGREDAVVMTRRLDGGGGDGVD